MACRCDDRARAVPGDLLPVAKTGCARVCRNWIPGGAGIGAVRSRSHEAVHLGEGRRLRHRACHPRERRTNGRNQSTAVRPGARSMTALKRVFVANRGEIALRIVRAAQALGLETIVGVSAADRDSAAARLADGIIVLGPAPAANSYLDARLVVHAAKARR